MNKLNLLKILNLLRGVKEKRIISIDSNYSVTSGGGEGEVNYSINLKYSINSEGRRRRE